MKKVVPCDSLGRSCEGHRNLLSYGADLQKNLEFGEQPPCPNFGECAMSSP